MHSTVAIPAFNSLGLLPPCDATAPTQQDRHHLLAERKFLQERMAALPLDARIMRISTESRLRAIDAQISLAPVDESEPARVTDVGQVKSSLARISQDNLYEEPQVLGGGGATVQ